ncbi:galactosylceramide sulfotransferase-like isoform X2 [Clavelina lepadiformis]|uniref:galactosylceramide sulfotransferase-like isoform X2 n=1 Tax=Clavelina lepadiformis TaxID=159417 RepID=UPI0040418830
MEYFLKWSRLNGLFKTSYKITLLVIVVCLNIWYVKFFVVQRAYAVIELGERLPERMSTSTVNNSKSLLQEEYSTTRSVLYDDNYVHKFPPPFIGGYPGFMQNKFVFFDNDDTTPELGSMCQNSACEFSVINGHFRLNLSVAKSVMPKRAKILSIVREPWRQFQSSFNYYYAVKGNQIKLGEKNMFGSNCLPYPYLQLAKGRFINVLEYLDLAYENLTRSIPYFFRSKNPQGFDLGIDPFIDNEEEIEEEIKHLESGLDLVMINEHIDESLVLLKNELKMDWEDLLQGDRKALDYIHFDLKSYSERYANFQHFFKLDLILYRHFNATLWRKVDEYGRERMNRDVTQLRKMKELDKAMNSRKPRRKSSTTNVDLEKLFYSIPKVYNETYLIDILYKKLKKQANRIRGNLAYDMARYMVANHGGCPL